MTPSRLSIGCGSGAIAQEVTAEIDRRLRPLEQGGKKQVILDIWVLRELLNRLPRMAEERPTS